MATLKATMTSNTSHMNVAVYMSLHKMCLDNTTFKNFKTFKKCMKCLEAFTASDAGQTLAAAVRQTRWP